MTTGPLFQAPSGDDAPAGHHHYKRPDSPYERFMAEEGIPVHHGIGVRDTRELELGAWPRMGGRGIFLQLEGLQGVKGMYVVEVPARGALNPERHMYDEFFLVIEGRGTTEVWQEGSDRRQAFEWQPGALFMAPLNAWHRLVNATSSPALVLVANNAPPIMNIYQSRRFIFDNPHQFTERYNAQDEYFKTVDKLEIDPVRGRAWLRANIYADIVNCELPLDNQRAPGYRRIQPGFWGYQQDGAAGGFIAQYPIGRYSKGHFHRSGAVVVCLQGKGYTYTWPREIGPQPWSNGKAHLVRRQDYVAGGLVAAAPGGGEWFHQHFGVGTEPLRVINFWGGPVPAWGVNDEQESEIKAGNLFSIYEGGRTIMYPEEDPYIRNEYRDLLASDRMPHQMPDALYQPK